MSKNVDEVIVKVPAETKTVTIKIEPPLQVEEEKAKAQKHKICD